MTYRAAIYCRLSQDRVGAGIVVDRQERDCRNLAEQLGWSVVRVFVDNDLSATNRRKPRPGYRALLAAMEAGKVDAVLAWHTDRLHRQPRELEDYIDVSQARGIVTRTVRAGHLDLATPSGRMLARNLGNAAKYEAEHLSERTIAGKSDAATRGAWAGGPRVYGYEIVPVAERMPSGSALRAVPAEAEVVRDAARRVLSGESLRSISRILNESGARTVRGGLWTGSALRKVLVRPTTAALRVKNGEVVGRDGWEPLLDEDTWRGVLAVLGDPERRTTDRYARRYLGSGLYRCGVCGGPLTGNTTAGGRRRAAYRCRAADRDGRGHVVRDVEQLDDFVSRVIVARLQQPDAAEALTPAAPDTAPLYEEAAALRGRLEEAARGWAAGALTQGQLRAATAELRARLELVEQRIGEAARGSALDGLAGVPDVAEVWDSLPLDRRRAVVDALATVVVLPRERQGRLPGGGYFDPEAVRVEWRTS